MIKISVDKLSTVTYGLFCAAGLNNENALTAADVFMRATTRGIYHHDITLLPGRLEQLASGKINPNPNIRLVAKKAAMETYEGDKGLGEINAMFVMRRCVELAKEHGIALCSVRNSNHFLASSPYVEVAAEAGMMGYVLTRGAPSMGAPGRKEQAIGASPQGFCIPTDKEYNLMFDACLAYTSFGALAEYVNNGKQIPAHWGFDKDGNPTTDPAEVIKGTRRPIGDHKGFGLAIMGELLTGLIADGQIIDEPQQDTGAVGMPSQTAICFDIGALLGQERMRARTSEIIDRMQNMAPGLKIPGQRSFQNRAEVQNSGLVELEEADIDKLNAWCKKLNVDII